ncbi:hypothetical protein ACHHYP_02253 [Achlya hypogyna]|uniref:Rab-GAP TBC domain-containing protein n=1 Tax=Achlya hypogyna TaxID=1202772 RepID=A0A1V9Z742_ACHHY|nr:hypothetical protein ACHHYP_02253 [Achlya hypogyna]
MQAAGDGTLLGRFIRSATSASLPLPSLSFPTSFSAPALAALDAPVEPVLHTIPCLKTGRLLVEIDGIQRQWESCTVSLVGTDISNLALYYVKDDSGKPATVIRLHSASIDLMEEIFSVITYEQTWYLCAESQRDAEDWADAICGALEAAAMGSTGRRRRLSSHVTASTVKEIQTRDIFTRVDEFVEIYVRSSAHDIHRQATRGAFSWSCLRNLTWRLWLGALPADSPFGSWVPATLAARAEYARLQAKYPFVLPTTSDDDSNEYHYGPVASPRDASLLLHTIHRDVVRTRCAMPYFRDGPVQTMLIRVLFIFAQEHPAMAYHQGMGELLAVIVYLLYIEQYPREPASGSPRDGRWSFETVSMAPGGQVVDDGAPWDDSSYVHVDVIDVGRDPVAIDKDRFLASRPFAADASKPTTACKEAIVDLLSTVTSGEAIEADAYSLLERLMSRMVGVFCPASSPTAASLHSQLERIQYELLPRADPELARHLGELHIVPEVYLLKWVRLLFAREFQMHQVWAVWDAVLSVSPHDLSFAHVICVALLHECRDELLAQDDVAGVLQALKDHGISYAKAVDTARELHDRLLTEDAGRLLSREHY